MTGIRVACSFVVALMSSTASADLDAPQPPADGKVRIELTAVTLGEDCAESAAGAQKPKAKSVRSNLRCGATSMQLAVIAGGGNSVNEVRVKRVELFDESGTLIGELTVRSASAWSESGTYEPWEGRVSPKQNLSVSYVLSQPNWAAVRDRRSKSYLLKAVLTVGGQDQNVQRDISVAGPTILPANVKT